MAWIQVLLSCFADDNLLNKPLNYVFNCFSWSQSYLTKCVFHRLHPSSQSPTSSGGIQPDRAGHCFVISSRYDSLIHAWLALCTHCVCVIATYESLNACWSDSVGIHHAPHIKAYFKILAKVPQQWKLLVNSTALFTGYYRTLMSFT